MIFCSVVIVSSDAAVGPGPAVRLVLANARTVIAGIHQPTAELADAHKRVLLSNLGFEIDQRLIRGNDA